MEDELRKKLDRYKDEFGNTGKMNIGRRNSGSCNTGKYNSGNNNTGNHNSGCFNVGDCNSGDWNQTSFSSGCFNTEEPKIFLFNQESDWTFRDWMHSRAREVLERVPVAGQKDIQKTSQQWYEGLQQEEKDCIRNLPNFDREIFRKITGIDVGEEN